jgi:hypothetical protein
MKNLGQPFITESHALPKFSVCWFKLIPVTRCWNYGEAEGEET